MIHGDDFYLEIVNFPFLVVYVIKFVKHFLNSTTDTQSWLLNPILVKNS